MAQGGARSIVTENRSQFWYLRAHPDARIKIAAVSDHATEVAIPIRKGEATASLRAVVNETIKGMRESGELAALSKRFFGTDISAPAAKP